MRKSILITGSTDGIGKLAAIKLAKDGHELYLHGRNSDKLSTVISEVKEISGNAHIKGFIADFTDFEAVTQLAQTLKTELPKIDVLINNAGVFNMAMIETKAGLDISFVVNYFAPYLLTNQLIPLLKKGSSPRIINVSSAAQLPVVHEVLMGKEKRESKEAYAQSKLALTMWSFFLAEKHSDLTVIAVNPGSLLDTKMVQEAFGHHWSPADKGASILYELAIAEAYKDATGTYFDNDKGAFGEAHPDAYNQAEIEKLIKVTDHFFNS
ncbi:MAG: SDR family NAD(P)-dependent oxidoreductase [Flammeovirgaceae bacterium]